MGLVLMLRVDSVLHVVQPQFLIQNKTSLTLMIIELMAAVNWRQAFGKYSNICIEAIIHDSKNYYRFSHLLPCVSKHTVYRSVYCLIAPG